MYVALSGVENRPPERQAVPVHGTKRSSPPPPQPVPVPVPCPDPWPDEIRLPPVASVTPGSRLRPESPAPAGSPARTEYRSTRDHLSRCVSSRSDRRRRRLWRQRRRRRWGHLRLRPRRPFPHPAIVPSISSRLKGAFLFFAVYYTSSSPPQLQINTWYRETNHQHAFPVFWFCELELLLASIVLI